MAVAFPNAIQTRGVDSRLIQLELHNLRYSVEATPTGEHQIVSLKLKKNPLWFRQRPLFADVDLLLKGAISCEKSS
jgi:hypothetical protein